MSSRALKFDSTSKLFGKYCEVNICQAWVKQRTAAPSRPGIVRNWDTAVGILGQSKNPG
jgi:hypothetical protein